MTAERNRPSVESGAVEVQSGGLNWYLNSNADTYPFPRLDPIYEARLAGWAEGWHARDREVTALQYTADRLYGVAYGQTVTPEPANRMTFAELEAQRDLIYSGGAK